MKNNKSRPILVVDNTDEESIRFENRLKRAYAMARETGKVIDSERNLSVVKDLDHKLEKINTKNQSQTVKHKLQLTSDNSDEVAKRIVNNLFLARPNEVEQDLDILRGKKSNASLVCVDPCSKKLK